MYGWLRQAQSGLPETCLSSQAPHHRRGGPCHTEHTGNGAQVIRSCWVRTTQCKLKDTEDVNVPLFVSSKLLLFNLW